MVWRMNVVICLDHQIESANAAENVARSGLLDGQSVCLLHINSAREQDENDSDLLQNIEHRIRSSSTPSKVDKLFASGTNTADLIMQKSSMVAADLLVVGARQRSSFERLVLGSVSQGLICKSKVPVLISRKSRDRQSGKILLALDDSPGSAAALHWISNQVWSGSKEIVMLSAVQRLSPSFYSQSDVARAAEELARHDWNETFRHALLEHWSKLLSEKLNQPSIPFAVTDGDAGVQIHKAASHWEAEFLVLGANQKTRTDRFLLGSVSQSLTVRVANSVLVVPETEANEFEHLRQQIHNSDQLALLLSEKPHPARTHSSITGTDINGFMPSW